MKIEKDLNCLLFQDYELNVSKSPSSLDTMILNFIMWLASQLALDFTMILIDIPRISAMSTFDEWRNE